jgi:hypothetical protein
VENASVAFGFADRRVRGVTIAIFLIQDFLPPRIAVAFRTLIEMLAAIPSVIFALWGIFVVIPFVRPGAGIVTSRRACDSAKSQTNGMACRANVSRKAPRSDIQLAIEEFAQRRRTRKVTFLF